MDTTMFNIGVIIIYVICIPGVCFSITAFCLVCSKSYYHNSFGILSGADVIAEGILIGNFLITITVGLLFPSINDTIFMGSLGYISIFIHRTTSYFQFLKSFNRFCAVVFYWKYSTIFKIKYTIFLIALCVGISIFHTFSYFDYSCHLLFSLNTLGWVRRDSKCVVFGTDFSFFMVVALYAGSILCNVVTVGYLRFRSSKNTQRKKLTWMEKRFLIQTSTTSIIYAAALGCRYLVTPFGNIFVLKFMLSNACWIFFILINEIVFVLSTIKFPQLFKTTPSTGSLLFAKSY